MSKDIVEGRLTDDYILSVAYDPKKRKNAYDKFVASVFWIIDESDPSDLTEIEVVKAIFSELADYQFDEGLEDD